MSKAALIFLVLIFISPSYGRKKPTLARALEEKVDILTVPAPLDDEVCFSPTEPCDIKLWKFIQSAQKSLDIAVFDITHVKIAHEIAAASKRLKVRVLVDTRQSKGKNSLVPMLEKAGVNVRYGYQRGIMHNKFTIVDGGRLETGSFNYTFGAANKNNENQIYLSHSKILERYKQRFESIWSEARTSLK